MDSMPLNCILENSPNGKFYDTCILLCFFFFKYGYLTDELYFGNIQYHIGESYFDESQWEKDN